MAAVLRVAWQLSCCSHVHGLQYRERPPQTTANARCTVRPLGMTGATVCGVTQGAACAICHGVVHACMPSFERVGIVPIIEYDFPAPVWP